MIDLSKKNQTLNEDVYCFVFYYKNVDQLLEHELQGAQVGD